MNEKTAVERTEVLVAFCGEDVEPERLSMATSEDVPSGLLSACPLVFVEGRRNCLKRLI